MNPTVELVLKHKKANMRKSEFLMLEALKSAPHLNDNDYYSYCNCNEFMCSIAAVFLKSHLRTSFWSRTLPCDCRRPSGRYINPSG